MDRAPLPSTEDANRVRRPANRDDLQDIAPSQVRAARGLLGWSAQRLAKLAKVDLGELIAFESDGYFLGALDFARVQRALIVGGVEFLPPTSQLLRGVQLAEPPRGGYIVFLGPPKPKRPWA